jgi:nucleoside-diphosphate-sugar epimerase
VLKEIYRKDITPEFMPWRKNDIRKSVADVRRARELLDFVAEIDFKSGIEELISSLG